MNHHTIYFMDVTDVTNDEQVARALLEAKANIEAAIPSGHTSLMLSAQHGHEQVCASRLEYSKLVDPPSQPFQNHEQ